MDVMTGAEDDSKRKEPRESIKVLKKDLLRGK